MKVLTSAFPIKINYPNSFCSIRTTKLSINLALDRGCGEYGGGAGVVCVCVHIRMRAGLCVCGIFQLLVLGNLEYVHVCMQVMGMFAVPVHRH